MKQLSKTQDTRKAAILNNKEYFVNQRVPKFLQQNNDPCKQYNWVNEDYLAYPVIYNIIITLKEDPLKEYIKETKIADSV